MVYVKGKGVLPQGGASEYNPLFSNIWVPLSLISSFTLTYFMIFVIPGLLFCGIMQLFGHLLLLTKETMKKVCVCLASTWYNHLVSNVTAYFVSILFSSVLFPVIHSAHIAHEWLLLKCSAIILGWYKIWLSCQNQITHVFSWNSTDEQYCHNRHLQGQQ